MNEIKKSLIEVTGDLSESKQKVRNRLNEQSNQKKDFKKNVIAAISAIAMIGTIFVSTTFLINQQKGTSEIAQPMTGIFDDEVFETITNLQKWWNDDGSQAYLKKVAYENYEKKLAIYTYALSLGYEITNDEVQENYQQTINHLTQSEEAKQSYTDLLTKSDLTWEEYEHYILDTAPYEVAQKKLEEHFIGIYPKIPSIIASSLAEKYAIPYFREQYVNDINAFKTKHTLPLYENNLFTGQIQLGRVVAIEDHMFLVAPRMTIEEIENHSKEELLDKYHNGDAIWFPMDDSPNLSIGDLVETHHKYETTSEDNITISDLWDVRLINEYKPESNMIITNQLTIENEMVAKVKVFVGTLTWNKTDIEFSTQSDYQFVVDGISYQLWSDSDGFVLYSSRGKYRTLNEEFTRELAGYLGIDPGLK